MHMYYTTKVYMTEYYRAELSKRVSVTRRTIEEEIQKMGEKYEVGKYPLLFLIYYWMYEIMYYSPKPDFVYRFFLAIMVPDG